MTDPRPSHILSEQDIWRPSWHAQHQVRDPKRLWLDKNESADPELRAVIYEILQKMPASVASAYPELPPLYGQLSKFLDVEPADLVLANGSDGVIRAAFDAFVDPGDIVIHTSPTYAMYSVYCQLKGAVEKSLDYQRIDNVWILDMKVLIESISELKPKLVCVPNPDSPTGSIIEKEQIFRLLEISEKVGALLLVDEAYFPFYEESMVTAVHTSPNLLITRSTGKAWGMAGLRLGFGIASPSIINMMQTTRSMYECNSVAAYVFSQLIDRYSEVEASVHRLTDSLNWFDDQMKVLGFKTIPATGNFIHVAFGDKEKAIAPRLADRVYYRRQTPHPSLEGFSRFSAASRDDFEEIVEIIKSSII